MFESSLQHALSAYNNAKTVQRAAVEAQKAAKKAKDEADRNYQQVLEGIEFLEAKISEIEDILARKDAALTLAIENYNILNDALQAKIREQQRLRERIPEIQRLIREIRENGSPSRRR
jgi:predicted RNase H-like nuclease (RuvC/YqgF family)